MDKLLREARELYDICEKVEGENLREALEDLRFRAGEQWDPDIKRNRVADGRPIMTINRVPQFVNQVVGNIRMNPPQIKVRAASGAATKAMADTFNGIIRNIEAMSRAQMVYISAAELSVACGQGFFRVNTQYSDDDGWDQDLRLERIMSPFSVMFDPGAISPVRDDADYCFVTDWVPKRTFQKMYPKASTSGWDASNAGNNDWSGWVKEDSVRVCEWWRKVPVTRRLFLLENLQTLDATDLDDEEIYQAIAAAGGYRRERNVKGHRVEMRLFNAVEEIAETTEWAGRYLPIIPVIGQEVHVGDRVVRHGLIRYARDPQRLYNIHRSAMAEAVATAPKAKWQATMKQVAGYEQYYATAHRTNYPFLPFTPDSQAPGPPMRIAPEMPNQALIAEMTMATGDMEATTGIYHENLGKETDAQSGKAILARQRPGDVGSFVYSDNLQEAVAHAGRILVDLIPRIYDNERIVRTLGEDGSEKFVQINATDPYTGQKVNDISAGEYDVVASVGPAYSTRAEEARDSLMNFAQAVPQVTTLAADLIAEAMDWPMADQIAARLRAPLVAQGVAEPKEGDPPPKPPAPDPNAMLAQAEMAKAQATIMKAQADMKEAEQRLQVEAVTKTAEEQRLRVEMAADFKQQQMEMRSELLQQVRDLQTKLEMQERTIAWEREKLVLTLSAQRQAAEVKAGPAVSLSLPEAATGEWAKGLEALVQQVADVSYRTQEMIERQDRGHAETREMMGHVARVVAAPRQMVRDQAGRPVRSEIVMEG